MTNYTMKYFMGLRGTFRNFWKNNESIYWWFFFEDHDDCQKRVLVPSYKIQYWCKLHTTSGGHQSSNIYVIVKKNGRIWPKIDEEKDFTVFQVRAGMGKHGEG